MEKQMTDTEKLVKLQIRSLQNSTMIEMLNIYRDFKKGVLNEEEARDMTTNFYDLLRQAMLEVGEEMPNAIKLKYKLFMHEYGKNVFVGL